jgi:phenylpropionate dioxygenase-like ring-hydroxylating dioxygenase large terminal subunit
MFIAHTNDLNDKKFIPVKQLNNLEVLVSDHGFKLVSNVCPHQKSIISRHSGTSNIRVCPYHNWSFDLNGRPVTSGRTVKHCQNLEHLKNKPVYNLLGLLFDQNVSCTDLDWLDLSFMELKEQRVDVVNADRYQIMDLFLDVDHIETVHSGVYDQIGISNINEVDWKFYSWGSLQIVKNNNENKAAWLAVYPGTMIEWQQGAMFITVTEFVSPKKSNVYVFKYADTRYNSLWSLNEKVWEEAWFQDKEQAELLTEFVSSNLEESKQHFRNWLKK